MPERHAERLANARVVERRQRAVAFRGIAGAIAKCALDHARGMKLTVVANCPYVAGYIKKHPEYEDLLAPSGSSRA